MLSTATTDDVDKIRSYLNRKVPDIYQEELEQAFTVAMCWSQKKFGSVDPALSAIFSHIIGNEDDGMYQPHSIGASILGSVIFAAEESRLTPSVSESK